MGCVHNITGQLVKGIKVIQHFSAKAGYITSVGVKFMTYERINNCSVTLQIVDMDGNIVARFDKACSSIASGKFVTFQINKPVCCDSRYKIVLLSNGTPGNAVTARYTKTKDNELFIVDNRVIPHHGLCVDIKYNKYKNITDKNSIEPLLQSIPNKDNKEFAIYTCVTNDYDTVSFPKTEFKNAQMFCFTDNIQVAHSMPNVIVLPIENIGLSACKTARMYKVLGHRIFKDFKYNIWLDGNMEIIEDLTKLVKYLNKHDIALFKHPLHSCVYKEARLCTRLRKDSEDIMTKQVNKYRDEGYPPNSGMVETGLMIRRTKETADIMEQWWAEIKQFSQRDQLSFNYTLWKNHFTKLYVIESKIRNSYVRKKYLHR